MRIRRTRSNNRYNPTAKQSGFVIAIFALVGLGMLGGAAYSAYETVTFGKTAGRAQGAVTALNYKHSSDGGGTYYPVVQWRAPDGRSRSFEGSVGSSPAAYDTGETVEVLYAPDDYANARLGGLSQWFLPVLLGVMGAMFAGLPLWSLGAPRREQARKQWLRRHGRCIQADVVDNISELPEATKKIAQFFIKDAENLDFTTNPRMVMARWTDPMTRKEYFFNLAQLSPETAEKAQAEGEIHVLIDPKKPSRYMARDEMVAG